MRYCVLLAVVIGLAESNVWAKPVTPDYSSLSPAHPARPPVRTLEPVAPTPPAPALEPVVPAPPKVNGQGSGMTICQPDIVVGDKVSKGGCVDAEIQYDDLNPPPKNAKDLFDPSHTMGVVYPSKPNVITVDKKIKGTFEELEVLTHEARHLLNLKNRFCEKYGYDGNSQECGLFDELSAYMSEGWTYEKAFNHIRDKYPEYREAIDQIEKVNAELGQKEICLPPSHDTSQSRLPATSQHELKQVGVKGWCRCGNQKGRIYSVGGGDAKGNQQGPYTYSLCGRCGKIERPEDADGSLWILDNEMERKRRLEKRKYSHQDFKEVERKLLAIPDGQIVIPGKCACTSPDPTKTGFVDNDEYYICCNCGRVYVPVGHSVPIGPTAKREMFGR